MTPQEREVMQMALDAMLGFPDDISDDMFESIKALRAALAQPEQEELGEIVPADEEQLKRIAKLVEPEQEPVPKRSKGALSHEENKQHNKMILDKFYEENAHLYTAPPQREWVGLTDEERQECLYSDPIFGMAASTFARAIEAKLKEKNGAI